MFLFWHMHMITFLQERARLEMERLAKHEEDLRLHAKKHDERRERKERERERREEERKQKELERIGKFTKECLTSIFDYTLLSI